jgi:3-deoxy-D-manno-octulosonic acid kinase
VIFVFPPPGFECVRDGRTLLLVRSDLHEWMVPLLRRAGANWDGYETRLLPGGRGGTLVVQAPGHEAVVVRPCRRGGLAARAARDVYFGWRPRPFRELRTVDSLRQAGAPVVEAYGAVVRWLGPAWYRGWLATRYVPTATTFWDWAAAAPPTPERQIVLRLIGRAIRRLHEHGGRHPDLNLRNILVCRGEKGADAPEIVFIDFDRARPVGHCRRPPSSELARLQRSARKLDPQGARITPADLEAMATAYREGEA